MSDIDLEQAVREAAGLAQPDFVWSAAKLAGPAAMLVNLPLGLALTIAGYVGASEARKKLAENYMPDEWLQKVAATEGVSAKGLAFLSERVAKSGRVSIAEAFEWIDLEKQEAYLAQQAEQQAEAGLNPGAQAILDRAKKEGANFIDPKLKAHIADAAQAASDAAMDVAGAALKTAAKHAPAAVAGLANWIRKL